MSVLGQLENKLGIKPVLFDNHSLGMDYKPSPTPIATKEKLDVVKPEPVKQVSACPDSKEKNWNKLEKKWCVESGTIRKLVTTIEWAMNHSNNKEQIAIAKEILDGINNGTLSKDRCNMLIREVNNLR